MVILWRLWPCSLPIFNTSRKTSRYAESKFSWALCPYSKAILEQDSRRSCLECARGMCIIIFFLQIPLATLPSWLEPSLYFESLLMFESINVFEVTGNHHYLLLCLHDLDRGCKLEVFFIEFEFTKNFVFGVSVHQKRLEFEYAALILTLSIYFSVLLILVELIDGSSYSWSAIVTSYFTSCCVWVLSYYDPKSTCLALIKQLTNQYWALYTLL